MVNAEFSENSLKRAYQEDFKAADHAHHLNNGQSIIIHFAVLTVFSAKLCIEHFRWRLLTGFAV